MKIFLDVFLTPFPNQSPSVFKFVYKFSARLSIPQRHYVTQVIPEFCNFLRLDLPEPELDSIAEKENQIRNTCINTMYLIHRNFCLRFGFGVCIGHSATYFGCSCFSCYMCT